MKQKAETKTQTETKQQCKNINRIRQRGKQKLQSIVGSSWSLNMRGSILKQKIQDDLSRLFQCEIQLVEHVMQCENAAGQWVPQQWFVWNLAPSSLTSHWHSTSLEAAVDCIRAKRKLLPAPPGKKAPRQEAKQNRFEGIDHAFVGKTFPDAMRYGGPSLITHRQPKCLQAHCTHSMSRFLSRFLFHSVSVCVFVFMSVCADLKKECYVFSAGYALQCTLQVVAKEHFKSKTNRNYRMSLALQTTNMQKQKQEQK